jgi:hypothetical protein
MLSLHGLAILVEIEHRSMSAIQEIVLTATRTRTERAGKGHRDATHL